MKKYLAPAITVLLYPCVNWANFSTHVLNPPKNIVCPPSPGHKKGTRIYKAKTGKENVTCKFQPKSAGPFNAICPSNVTLSAIFGFNKGSHTIQLSKNCNCQLAKTLFISSNSPHTTTLYINDLKCKNSLQNPSSFKKITSAKDFSTQPYNNLITLMQKIKNQIYVPEDANYTKLKQAETLAKITLNLVMSKLNKINNTELLDESTKINAAYLNEEQLNVLNDNNKLLREANRELRQAINS